MKIFYDSYSKDFSHVADRRRFGGFLKFFNIESLPETGFKDADLIVLSQASNLSEWVKRGKGGSKLIFDFCDAYLLEPPSFKSRFRGLFKYLVGQEKYFYVSYKKLQQKVLKMADAVICASNEQKESILPYCANTHVILDFQEKDISHKKNNYLSGKAINLLWEGLPSSLITFKEFDQILLELNKKFVVNLHLITDLQIPVLRNMFMRSTSKYIKKIFPSFPNVFLYQWNKEMFSVIATACDIAVIPIDVSNPLLKAKAANKLHLLWRMGIPVITSATPSYCESMANAKQDIYCVDSKEWYSKLELLAKDEQERKRLGELGYTFVQSYHSDKAEAKRWNEVFRSIGFADRER